MRTQVGYDRNAALRTFSVCLCSGRNGVRDYTLSIEAGGSAAVKTKDVAKFIFSSPQFRELMGALEEAKKQLSPEEWQRVSSALISDVEAYVEQRLAELSEGREVRKTFLA